MTNLQWKSPKAEYKEIGPGHWEYVALDYLGRPHYDMFMGSEAVRLAMESNRAIVDHYRHCSSDYEPIPSAAAIDRDSAF